MDGAVPLLFHASSWRGRRKTIEEMEYTSVALKLLVTTVRIQRIAKQFAPSFYLAHTYETLNEGSKNPDFNIHRDTVTPLQNLPVNDDYVNTQSFLSE